ncbi:MAG TPA: hypothetical protein VFE79_20745, partial [Paraburkholderia sp.]|nr:hypothetical protein [Paraburkholderia sp.]
MTTRLSNKQLLLSKLETTYNTNPTLNGPQAILASNLSFAPNAGSAIPRDRAYPNFGKSQQGMETPYSTLSMDVDMAGSGAAGTAPLYGPLLRACGFSETITASTSVEYSSISGSFESIYQRFNWDGVAQDLGGCRGKVSLKIEANKEPAWTFAFSGLYHPPADISFITGIPTTLNAWIDPVTVSLANTTFSLFGVNSALSSLSIDWGQKVTFSDKPNRAGIDMTDRVVTATAVVEAASVASIDWDTKVATK